MTKLLTLNNIDKSYAKQNVLNDVSLSINKGEITTLFIDPNGANQWDFPIRSGVKP